VFARDFPHSRQNRPDRGVISLQKGHILCDLEFWVVGSMATTEKKLTITASLLRKRLRSRPSVIDLPCSSYRKKPFAARKQMPLAIEYVLPLRNSGKSTMTGPGQRRCAGLLTILPNLQKAAKRRRMWLL
jgi:hypothetical protein